MASTPGRGSTFTVYLPTDGAPSAPVVSEGQDETVGGDLEVPPTPLRSELIGVEPYHVGADELSDGAFHGMRILIVDDEFRNIFALSALLERGHADITVAESGAEALALLERERDFDVVLMDIMMPVMDGYQTIGAIRMIDRLKTVPIIAVTGKVMDGERQRCLDAGADDYVPKPIITASLVAALRPWTRSEASNGPTAVTTAAPLPSSPLIPTWSCMPMVPLPTAATTGPSRPPRPARSQEPLPESASWWWTTTSGTCLPSRRSSNEATPMSRWPRAAPVL